MSAALAVRITDDMSASALTDRGAASAAPSARADQRIEGAPSPEGIPLFVIPCRGGNGFRASIRGHVLDLADPDSGHGLAPTPDDLRTAALASDVAWFARRFLREHELEDYVGVTVWARSSAAPPGLGRFEVKVEVSTRAAALGETLASALERRFAAQSPPPRFEVVHAS